MLLSADKDKMWRMMLSGREPPPTITMWPVAPGMPCHANEVADEADELVQLLSRLAISTKLTDNKILLIMTELCYPGAAVINHKWPCSADWPIGCINRIQY